MLELTSCSDRHPDLPAGRRLSSEENSPATQIWAQTGLKRSRFDQRRGENPPESWKLEGEGGELTLGGVGVVGGRLEEWLSC